MIRSILALPAAALLLAANVTPVQAKSVLFNFNPATLPAPYNKSPYNKALPNNTSAPTSSADDSSQVQTYMDEMLSTVEPTGSKWAVTVKGAESSGLPGGTVADAGYTGDSHVICKGSTSGSSCVPDTLATKDNTPFLMTDGAFAVNGDNAIQMQFTGGVSVSSLSFDFEIFPNGNCANGNSGCTVPDFTFTMLNGSNKTVVTETVDALLPGKTSTPINTTLAGGITYTESGGASGTTNKNSELSTTELSDQYIGTMTFTFATPVTDPTLQFIDWPDTVAVANINWGLGVPAPASLLLLVSGLIGIGFARRKLLKQS